MQNKSASLDLHLSSHYPPVVQTQSIRNLFLDLLRRKEVLGGGSEPVELSRPRRRRTDGAMTEELMIDGDVLPLSCERTDSKVSLRRNTQEDSPQLPLSCGLRLGGGACIPPGLFIWRISDGKYSSLKGAGYFNSQTALHSAPRLIRLDSRICISAE